MKMYSLQYSYFTKTDQRRIMAENSSTRAHQIATNRARNALVTSSNGSKHSKFQRPNTERSHGVSFQSPNVSRNGDLDPDSTWLCSHYKRQCYVKFQCCDEFWPCHRCHNNQSSCGRKKLKSRDTEMVKCAHCNKVQEVINVKVEVRTLLFIYCLH